MRFMVIWLDGEGFADYAEHFDHGGFQSATEYLGRRLVKKPKASGYFLAYADSEFIRKHDRNTGGPKRTRALRIALEEVIDSYPHLKKT